MKPSIVLRLCLALVGCFFGPLLVLWLVFLVAQL